MLRKNDLAQTTGITSGNNAIEDLPDESETLRNIRAILATFTEGMYRTSAELFQG